MGESLERLADNMARACAAIAHARRAGGNIVEASLKHRDAQVAFHAAVAELRAENERLTKELANLRIGFQVIASELNAAHELLTQLWNKED